MEYRVPTSRCRPQGRRLPSRDRTNTMLSRPLMIATLLGTAIGAPYLVSHSSGITSQISRPFSGSGPTSPAGPASISNPSSPVAFDSPDSLLYNSPVPLEGARVHSLAEVFRFDLTKEWVYSNWARKSTGLADAELFGVRVPLVTGTGMTDLAGSLTYYFNAQGQVQHITFVGKTADTTQLVNFITSTYKLQRVAAPAGDQLYQLKRSGQVQSQLRTQPDGVLWTTSPHGSFLVDLALERPGSNRSLPPPTPLLDLGSAPAVGSSAMPPAASTAAPAANGEQSSQGGVMSKIFPKDARYATPEEQRQLEAQRWPQ
jgi:Family of unknown function (DUF6690)